MKEQKLEKEILLSHRRCTQLNLPKNLRRPKNRVTGTKLEKRLEDNKCLIKSFRKSVDEINDFITEDYLFLLVNYDGILLCQKTTWNNNIYIEPGVSFNYKSIGTNAVSLAKKLNSEIFLTPEQHYCDFFKKWYCFTAPIYYQKEIIGFLDISLIKEKIKKELKGITVLLKDRISKKLDRLNQKNKSVELTCKQVEVLEYLSYGLTEKEVASEMYCSKSTIKYHKKTIFEKLDVTNSRKAIIKGIKLGIINLDEINL